MNQFLDRYYNYSNYELLKIIKRPENYQLEAIQAAEKILKDRIVSDDDINQVEKYYQEIDYQKKITQEKRESIYKNLNAHFNVFANTNNILDVEKWLNIYLLFMAGELLIKLYKFVRFVITFKENCEFCTLDFSDYFYVIFDCLFIPIVGFLLYKRKRLGWVLLIAKSTITLMYYFAYSSALIFFNTFFLSYISFLLWVFFINIATLIFFWKTEVAELFNISKQQKIKYYANIFILCFLAILLLVLYQVKLYQMYAE